MWNEKRNCITIKTAEYFIQPILDMKINNIRIACKMGINLHESLFEINKDPCSKKK